MVGWRHERRRPAPGVCSRHLWRDDSIFCSLIRTTWASRNSGLVHIEFGHGKESGMLGWAVERRPPFRLLLSTPTKEICHTSAGV